MNATTRRQFLQTAAIVLLMPFIMRATRALAAVQKLALSDDAWRKRLSPEEYRVMRDHGTERAFSSPLEAEHRPGIFLCAACNRQLFSSKDKFDSGTGWPSFTQPIEADAVETSTDFKLVLPRTEVHCARCGGHLGHLFNDGPAPTGKRYCMNGVALHFMPNG